MIVIGGIGSIRAPSRAAASAWPTRSAARSWSTSRLAIGPSPARTIGPAIGSMLIYLVMALVLTFRPRGCFVGSMRSAGLLLLLIVIVCWYE